MNDGRGDPSRCIRLRASLRPALRAVPAVVRTRGRSRRQAPGHGRVSGGLFVRHVRLCLGPQYPRVRHAALPDRRRRGRGRADVTRLHRGQVPLPGPADCARAVHERVDDRADCRQHAGRHLRSIPWLALCLRGLRHRRARRVGHARARGVDFRSRERRRAGIRDFHRAARWIADLRGAARRAPDRGGDGARRRRRVPARVRASDSIRRHPDAADGSRGARPR